MNMLDMILIKGTVDITSSVKNEAANRKLHYVTIRQLSGLKVEVLNVGEDDSGQNVKYRLTIKDRDERSLFDETAWISVRYEDCKMLAAKIEELVHYQINELMRAIYHRANALQEHQTSSFIIEMSDYVGMRKAVQLQGSSFSKPKTSEKELADECVNNGQSTGWFPSWRG